MDDILIRKDRRAGRITLDRPQALNALSQDMVNEVTAAMRQWRDDPAVELVILDAAGPRAFCAGGDIGALYSAGRQGDHHVARAFFRDEYRMNACIAEFPKPVVAFMQGYVMGGGVGLAGHASHRIVCDTSRIAMPEVGIGLIPDVGGTWLLGRAPGRCGEYLGLTGAQMEPGDALFAGFADHYLAEAEWPGLIDELAASGDASLVAGTPPPEASLDRLDLAAFAGAGVDEIMGELERTGQAAILDRMRQNSPLSMAATLVLIRAARSDDRMRQSLAREFRFSARATERSDFLEGVRAQVIDKDRRPVWRAGHGPEEVAAILAPLGDEELMIEEEA
jgi:enoyl-CoA hydratase/carnithine racemase